MSERKLPTEVYIYGEDRRNVYLSAMFADIGAEVTLRVFPDNANAGEDENELSCGENETSVAVFSFSLGEREQCEFMRGTKRGTTVFCGALCDEAKRIAAVRRINLSYLLNDDLFCRENAIPTAEGALAIAINETDITLSGAAVLILGFGRVASETARVFSGIGAEVFCVVRSEKSRKRVENVGYEPLMLTESGIPGSYRLSNFRLIINTVPPPGIMTHELARRLCGDAVFIELAGGKAIEILKQYGIKAIAAPGLPGKSAPRSAAKYIYEAIISGMNR